MWLDGQDSWCHLKVQLWKSGCSGSILCISANTLPFLSSFLRWCSSPSPRRTASVRKAGIRSAEDLCMAADAWLHIPRGAINICTLTGTQSHTGPFGSWDLVALGPNSALTHRASLVLLMAVRISQVSSSGARSRISPLNWRPTAWMLLSPCGCLPLLGCIFWEGELLLSKGGHRRVCRVRSCAGIGQHNPLKSQIERPKEFCSVRRSWDKNNTECTWGAGGPFLTHLFLYESVTSPVT